MSKTKTEIVGDRHPPGDERAPEAPQAPAGPKQKPGEIGGRKGPEPTRYGDWEVDGRCTDF